MCCANTIIDQIYIQKEYILNYKRNQTGIATLKCGISPCETIQLGLKMFEKQSQTFDVTMAFMFFSRIIHIAQAASKFGREYCFELGKPNATLKFLNSSLMQN